MSLSKVAFSAGRNQIIPGRAAPTRSRKYMVEIQITRWKTTIAVLARKLVTQEHISARETNPRMRHPIVMGEKHDSRNPQRAAKGGHEVFLWLGPSGRPGLEIERFGPRSEGPSGAQVKHHERLTGRGRSNGLKASIEDQHRYREAISMKSNSMRHDSSLAQGPRVSGQDRKRESSRSHPGDDSGYA